LGKITPLAPKSLAQEKQQKKGLFQAPLTPLSLSYKNHRKPFISAVFQAKIQPMYNLCTTYASKFVQKPTKNTSKIQPMTHFCTFRFGSLIGQNRSNYL
jgi:hypothetical protein